MCSLIFPRISACRGAIKASTLPWSAFRQLRRKSDPAQWGVSLGIIYSTIEFREKSMCFCVVDPVPTKYVLSLIL